MNTTTIPQESNSAMPGYDQWLDEVAETLPPALPPRESLLKRMADAVTFSFLNFVKSESGTWLVPSRVAGCKAHRVTDDGCDCRDFQVRCICAHWLATGDRATACFLVARIQRAKGLGELDRIVERIAEPGFIEVPTELLAFVRMEFKIRRAQLQGHTLKPAETPRSAMLRLVKGRVDPDEPDCIAAVTRLPGGVGAAVSMKETPRETVARLSAAGAIRNLSAGEKPIGRPHKPYRMRMVGAGTGKSGVAFSHKAGAGSVQDQIARAGRGDAA
jgi:hypothetical protein